MRMIQNIRLLAYAVIFTSISLAMGQAASAGQFEVKGQKEIFYSIGKSDLIIKAGKRLETGKLEQAQRLYRQSLNETLRNSDRVIAYINLSVIHNSQGEYEKALKYSNKALKLASDNWHAFNNRGTAYFGLGKYELAQQDYAMALSLNPGDNRLLLNKQLARSKANAEYANTP